MRTLSLLALAGLALGCSRSPLQAPFGASVSFSEHTFNVSIGLWCNSEIDREPDFNGHMQMLDLLVVDGNTELPLERIEVELEVTSVGGIYVLPQEAIKTVDFPTVPDTITTEADLLDACTDEDGNFDNSEDFCAWYYDEDNTEFYQFGADYADAAGYAPTYMVGQTDHRGVMRAYVFYDCIYGSEATIEASIGVANDTFTVAGSSD